MSVLRIPSQSQISQTYRQGSLQRSVSQLMDIQDKKVLSDDSIWETIMGRNSGLVSRQQGWVERVSSPHTAAPGQRATLDARNYVTTHCYCYCLVTGQKLLLDLLYDKMLRNYRKKQKLT